MEVDIRGDGGDLVVEVIEVYGTGTNCCMYYNQGNILYAINMLLRALEVGGKPSSKTYHDDTAQRPVPGQFIPMDHLYRLLLCDSIGRIESS